MARLCSAPMPSPKAMRSRMKTKTMTSVAEAMEAVLGALMESFRLKSTQPERDGSCAKQL